MKLLVRNIPRNLSEAELLALFSEHGPVQSCSLVMDEQSGESKGFGFVDLPKAAHAMAAMKTLNGMTIGNSTLRVKRDESKRKNQ